MNQPLRIEEITCEIARLEAKAADCRDLMAIIEARELLVIVQRTDSAGKLLYTNAESRAAAVLTELVANKTWAETRAELRDVQVSIKVRQAQVEKLRAESVLGIQLRREQLAVRQQLSLTAAHPRGVSIGARRGRVNIWRRVLVISNLSVGDWICRRTGVYFTAYQHPSVYSPTPFTTPII